MVGGDGEREREKRKGGGAKRDNVPVPVLNLTFSMVNEMTTWVWMVEYVFSNLSGRCSPWARMLRIRLRYWCSSCTDEPLMG